jgi:hypothetical protein
MGFAEKSGFKFIASISWLPCARRLSCVPIILEVIFNSGFKEIFEQL